MFLKKYNLVFNQDSKTIGFYSNMININETKSEDFIDNKNKHNFSFTNLLLILILVSILVIGALIYRRRINRKMRANELEDQFQYVSKNDDTNKIINDDIM